MPFVDTAGWMAMADEGDAMHESSRRVRDAFLRDAGILVSTDYVMDETPTPIRMRLGLAAAAAWWAQVAVSTRVRWEPVDPVPAEKARRWFFQWRDKDSRRTARASGS